MGSIFGVGRKTPPEKFSGGGHVVLAGMLAGEDGGWPAVGRWPVAAGNIGRERVFICVYATNLETSEDVYSRHRIIVVTSLKIMEFFGYKHSEEIIVRRQDDRLYKFREGDFKRLHRQDIKDMLLLLCTHELHKFSDGTLDHVRTTLNDIATGIQMEYLPKRKWSKQDKQRDRVMINAIDKKLRDRRLMRSLERSNLNIRVILFTVKMEILLEPTSNKLMVEHAEYDESNTYVLERFNTTAGNPVKEILLKLNLPDHSNSLLSLLNVLVCPLRRSDNREHVIRINLILCRSSRIRRIRKDGGEST
ncbi:hypothetical protein Tco_0340227 [Tanacetum coccineum]